MSEINSVKALVNRYMTKLASANSNLKSDGSAVAVDSTTTLSVNGNGSEVNCEAEEAIASLSRQIDTDKGRITDMAELFESLDKKIAGAK